MSGDFIDLEEIYDWQSTSAIYNDYIVSVDGQNGMASLHVPLSCQHLIAIRILPPITENSKVNPLWKYLVLSEMDDPPIIELSFQYPASNEPECCPNSVSIDIIQFPKLWPTAEKKLWMA